MTELSAEDKQFIKELREKHEDGKINRRQALGMLGAAGVGAAGGFFGTGSASADASTSDSDGNVGLPGDRVDVFAEGADIKNVSKNVGMQTVTVYRDPDTDECVASLVDGTEVARQAGTGRIGPVIESVLNSEGGRTYIFVEDGFYNIPDGDAVTGIDWPNRVTIEFSAGTEISVTQSLTNSVGNDNHSCIFNVRLSGGTTNNIRFIGNGSFINCGENVDIPFYFSSGRNNHLRGLEIQSPSYGGWRFTLEDGSGHEFNEARNIRISDPDNVSPSANGEWIGGTDPRCFRCEGPGDIGWLFEDTGKIQASDLTWFDMTGQSDAVHIHANTQPVSGEVRNVLFEGDSAPRSGVRIEGGDGAVENLDVGPVIMTNSDNDTTIVQLVEGGGTGSFRKPTIKVREDKFDSADSTTLVEDVGNNLSAADSRGLKIDITYDAANANVYHAISNLTGIAVVNGTGRESAGAGNPPSTDWPYGVAVENVDDNTFWKIDNSKGTVQIG